jgi:hypothetical protein
VQVILDHDEAWSLMTLVTSYVIDNSGVSQDGKQKLRRWRTDRAGGTVAMTALAEAMNKSLGAFMDERTNRQVRAKGRYTKKKATA